jgi:tetratricopeptide (TPR) repeat protein
MSRERAPSYDDLPGEPAEAGPRATSRWIAGVVILAVAGLLAATVGHKYLARFSSAPKPAPSARDTRAAGFLAEGMRLLDEAQYDEAQVALVKAQALADRDPAVLAGLAQVETLRAEMFWLKLRLLDPTAAALVQATERELGERVAKARTAVDTAFAVAPEDPGVIRARVNVLRIAGDESKAREWIQPVAANPADPQNAFVLAALDLAEAAPAWSTVIDRLRAAAVSGKDVARARATLIYALVRAGRVVEAGTELAKVENAERPHPLLPELKGFVARFSAPLDGGVDAADPTSSAAEAAPPAAVAAESAPGADGPAAAANPVGDFRKRLTQAAASVSSGDLARADHLYRSVLNEQPGNTEALAGLADVARRRNDPTTASRLYAEVLEANPSYLPALMATADQKWQAGDRKGAIVLYRRILEQAGPSTDYGQRAQARIAQGDGGDSGGAKSAPAPASTPAQPPPPNPEIDTSDLPGVTPP